MLCLLGVGIAPAWPQRQAHRVMHTHTLPGQLVTLLNTRFVMPCQINTPPPSPDPQVYSQLEGDTSHVVNTAWAMLALMAAEYHKVDRRPLDAAARFLVRMQVGWDEEAGPRVRACMCACVHCVFTDA